MESLKLNLGCGTKKQKGYVNIDLRPEVYPDLIADVKRLHFQIESVDQVYASDILEHLGIKGSMDALSHWSSLLKIGGMIYIKTPCLHCLVEQYPKSKNVMKDIVVGLYGYQDYHLNVHSTVYDEKLLIQALNKFQVKKISCKHINWNLEFWGQKEKKNENDNAG